MNFNILRVAGSLLLFIGTYLMVASYEEYYHGSKRKSNYFILTSTGVYILSAILVGI